MTVTLAVLRGHLLKPGLSTAELQGRQGWLRYRLLGIHKEGGKHLNT